MNDKIRQALSELDPENDEHWTTAGVPAMAVVQQMAGVQVTRAQINDLAPDFTRSSRVLPGDVAAPAGASPPAMSPLLAQELEAHRVAPSEPTLDDLRARAKMLARHHSELSSHISKAKLDLDQLERERSALDVEIERRTPSLSPAERYKQVLARQQEERKERADRLAQLFPVEAPMPPAAEVPGGGEMSEAERYKQVTARNQAERKVRADRAAAFAGVFPEAQRSRLDQAMRRRSGYGFQRPSYPRMGGTGK